MVGRPPAASAGFSNLGRSCQIRVTDVTVSVAIHFGQLSRRHAQKEANACANSTSSSISIARLLSTTLRSLLTYRSFDL